MNNLISKTWCPCPWNGLFINIDSSMSPCAHSTKFKCNSIEEFKSLLELVTLREDLLVGRENSICEFCNNFGELGTDANPRQQAMPNDEHRIQEILTSGKIDCCEIRFSNVCNFKCRTCSPLASSTIAAERNLYGGNFPVVITYLDGNLLSQIKKISHQLTHLHITGGEPVVAKQFWELLDYLISTGDSANIDLCYGTNGSKLSYRNKSIFNYWQHFKSVTVIVSIDAYGPADEYWRHGTNWLTLNDNMRQMVDDGHATVRVNTVATWITAFSIVELYQFLIDTYQIVPTLSRVDSSKTYLSMQILSRQKKDLLAAKLRELPISNNVNKAEIENIIEHMNSQDLSHLVPNALAEQFEFDLRRGESFFDIFPEHTELQ